MARINTLRARVREIRRKFKHVSPFRYFYNNKRELKQKVNRIRVWFLIHDAEKGYSVFPMQFQRALPMSLDQWRALFTKQVNMGERTYDPLFPIFVLKVLPAINVRRDAAWKFKTLIGWTGANDIPASRHSNSSSARNKTAKKRNANARHSNRRRQRNG